MPVVYRAMDCGQKIFKLMWRCNQLLSGILANNQLSRVSRQSHPSTNDNGDNEIKYGTMYRSPRFLAFTSWLRKPRKISANRPSNEAVWPIIASNGSLTSKWRRYDRSARQGRRRYMFMFAMLKFCSPPKNSFHCRSFCYPFHYLFFTYAIFCDCWSWLLKLFTYF